MFSFNPTYTFHQPSRSSFSSFIENFKPKTNSNLSLEKAFQPAIQYRVKHIKNNVEILQRRHSYHSTDDYKSKENVTLYFRGNKNYSKSSSHLAPSNRKEIMTEIAFKREFKAIPPSSTHKKISPHQISHFDPLKNNASDNLYPDANTMLNISKETGETLILKSKSIEKWKPLAKNSSRVLYKGIADNTVDELDTNLIKKRKELVVNPVGVAIQHSIKRADWNQSLLKKSDSLSKNTLDKIVNVSKSIFRVVARILEEMVEKMILDIDKSSSNGRIGVEDAIRIFIRLSKSFGVKTNEIEIQKFFKRLSIDSEYKLNLKEFKKNFMGLVF